jgi:tetratricopeptide (TPR) repeat protein
MNKLLLSCVALWTSVALCADLSAWQSFQSQPIADKAVDASSGGNQEASASRLSDNGDFGMDLDNALLNLQGKLGKLMIEVDRSNPAVAPQEMPTQMEAFQQKVIDSRQRLDLYFEQTEFDIQLLLGAPTYEAPRTQNLPAERPQVAPTPLENSLPAKTSEPQIQSQIDRDIKQPSSEAAEKLDAAIKRLQEKSAAIAIQPVVNPAHEQLISAQAINQLALADNVFAVGDVAVARQLYAELLTRTTDAEETLWIKFQLAACYRRLQNFDEAERLLREITNAGGERFPVPQARWWLSMIERRLKTEHAIQSIQTQIESIREQQINEPAK